MGIQDRDYYWKDRDIGGERFPKSVNLPVDKVVPKGGVIWGFLSRPWVAPFIFGTVVGRSWESLKQLGQLVYERFLGSLF